MTKRLYQDRDGSSMPKIWNLTSSMSGWKRRKTIPTILKPVVTEITDVICYRWPG
jgi:hypothetical protein